MDTDTSQTEPNSQQGARPSSHFGSPTGLCSLISTFHSIFEFQGWLNIPLPPSTVAVPGLVYGTADGGKDNSQCNAVSLNMKIHSFSSQSHMDARKSHFGCKNIFKISRPI